MVKCEKEMQKIFLYIIIVFSFFSTIEAQEKREDASSLRIAFAGDIMGHDGQIASAAIGDAYNYDTCFSLLKPYLNSVDIAIANLEVTLAGAPYKGYPQFSSPDELAQAAKDAGFDLFVTANNHSLDRYFKGITRTTSVLADKGIIHTGTFASAQSKEMTYPLIIEKNGIRLAILNYTYGTNGISVPETFAVNYIDTTQIREDIQKARQAEPDYIIAVMHWGIEYQRNEDARQQKIAESLFSLGADAVIGSHPHVIQPITNHYRDPADSTNFNVVVYSLGNFISNQRDRYRDGGIIYELVLEKTDKVRIKEQSYMPVWVYKPLKKDGSRLFVLVPENLDESVKDELSMPSDDQKLMQTFFEDTHSHLK